MPDTRDRSPDGHEPYPLPGAADSVRMQWPARSEYLTWRMAEWAGMPKLGTAMRLAGREGAGPPSRESVVFGDDLEQRLEVVAPVSDDPPVTRPGGAGIGPPAVAALFVHGGSWRTGAPEDYRFVGNWFAERGIPSAVTGYRHAPDHVWPAQRDDVLSAMKLVLERTGARRLIVAGHSAGAQLAAAAVYDRSARREAGVADDAIAGLVALSGPLDLRVICPTTAACPLLGLLMGGDEGWERADPALLFRRGDPWPVLVMHGARDPIVNVASSVRFAASAAEGGLPVELLVSATAGHSTLLWAFLGDEVLQGPVARFVDRYAGVASSAEPPAGEGTGDAGRQDGRKGTA
jgi:acetyl esterase/lipase